MKYNQRQVAQVISQVEKAPYLKEHVEQFFNNPIWLAFKQECIRQWDDAVGEMINADNMLTVAQAKGTVRAMDFILESETIILNFAKEANDEDIKKTAMISERLKQLYKLMETATDGN